MRPILLLAAKFIAITVPFTWLWLEWGRDAYFRLFMTLARPFLIFLGVTNFPPSMVKDRFLNYLPFVVLMLITPAMSIKRRALGTLAGIVTLFFGHVGLTWAVYLTFVKDGVTRDSAAQIFPVWMISDALPFFLWALIANHFVRECAQRFGASKRT